MLVGNKSQIQPDIILSLELKNHVLTNASVRIQNVNNKQLLKYRQFIKASSNKNETKIIIKGTGKVLASWISNSIDFKSTFETIDDDIDFLERLVCIEGFLKKEIKVESVSYDDYSVLHYVSDLISGKESSAAWETFEVQDKVSEQLLEIIRHSKQGEFISIFGLTRFVHDLFGERIDLPIYRFYSAARIVDYDRKCKQIEYSDKGDPITLKFEPINKPSIVTDIYEPYAFRDLAPDERREIMKDHSMIFVHESSGDEDLQIKIQ